MLKILISIHEKNRNETSNRKRENPRKSVEKSNHQSDDESVMHDVLRASAAKNQKKWNHGGRRNSFILIFLQSISWVDHKSKISALKHVRFLRYRQFKNV